VEVEKAEVEKVAEAMDPRKVNRKGRWDIL